MHLGRDSAYQLIAEHMMRLTRCSGAAIALETHRAIVCRASAGHAPHVGVVLQPDLGLSGECFRTGTIVRCDDTQTDPRLDPEVSDLLGFRSALMLPIRMGQRTIGILEVLASEPRHFDNGDVFVLSGLAELVVEIEKPEEVRELPGKKKEPQSYSHFDTRRPSTTPNIAIQMRTSDGRLICDACGFLNESTEKNCENCDIPLPIALPEVVQADVPDSAASQVATSPPAEIGPSERRPSPDWMKFAVLSVLCCIALGLIVHNRKLLWRSGHGKNSQPSSLSGNNPATPAGTTAPGTTAPGATALSSEPSSAVPIKESGGELIYQPKPAYPDAAKKLGITGTVVLHFVVNSRGSVENVRLVSGDGLLAGAAMQAVRRWKYHPFLINGEPAAKQMDVTFDFSLE